MTARTYTLADSSGTFGAVLVVTEPSDLLGNTPAGSVPIEGRYGASSRWDAATGRVVPVTPYKPTDEELAAAARATRDGLLSASDWTVTRALETGEPLSPAWTDYRQALRDVPAQAGFPGTIDWPVQPAA